MQTQDLSSHGLSQVEVGGRIEIRQGSRVVAFGTDPDKVIQRALLKMEEERLRKVDPLPEDREPVLVVNKKLPECVEQAFAEPVPETGAYELPAKKSVVKPKFREKYKANGDFSCGDFIAEELKAFVQVLKGTRMVVDEAKLRIVADTNKIWEERYAALNMGLRRMTIGNRLRHKYENGERIDIGGCVFEQQYD